MSFSPQRGANSAPQIPFLDLRGHFEVVKSAEKGRKRGKETEG